MKHLSALSSRDLLWCAPLAPSVYDAWVSFLQECWRKVGLGLLAFETARRYAELLPRLDALAELPIASLTTPAVHDWHQRLGELRRQRDGAPQLRSADYCRDTLALVCAHAELKGWRPRLGEDECRRIVAALLTLPLPGPVLQLLQSQRDRVGELSPLVFPSAKGTPITNLWHVWQEILAIAGLRGIPLYGLRHNAASHWLEAGLDHEEVARILGNTAASVRRHYDHSTYSPLDEQAAEAGAQVMRRIGGGS